MMNLNFKPDYQSFAELAPNMCILFVILSLVSCTALTPREEYEQEYQQEYSFVASQTEKEFDPLSKAFEYSSPPVGGGLLDNLGADYSVQNQLFFSKDTYLLVSKISSKQWFLIHKVTAESFGELEVQDYDRTQGGAGRVSERVSLVLPAQVLARAKAKGLRIQLEGKYGNAQTELSGAMISGFMDAIEQQPKY